LQPLPLVVSAERIVIDIGLGALNRATLWIAQWSVVIAATASDAHHEGSYQDPHSLRPFGLLLNNHERGHRFHLRSLQSHDVTPTARVRWAFSYSPRHAAATASRVASWQPCGRFRLSAPGFARLSLQSVDPVEQRAAVRGEHIQRPCLAQADRLAHHLRRPAPIAQRRIAAALLAVMDFAAFPATEMRATALLLNIVAAGYATWRLHRRGAVERKILLPLTIPSLVTAFLAACWCSAVRTISSRRACCWSPPLRWWERGTGYALAAILLFAGIRLLFR
jgi:hypothetical protein